MVSIFFCQGLLLGLSFIAALMAIRFDSEHLFDCLQLLEPWFSAMMLVCSEIALVGSLLQVCQARERLSAIPDALLRQPHQHLVQIRRASRAQASLSIALALANVVVMACC